MTALLNLYEHLSWKSSRGKGWWERAVKGRKHRKLCVSTLLIELGHNIINRYSEKFSSPWSQVMSPERKGYEKVEGRKRWLMLTRMFSHRKLHGERNFRPEFLQQDFYLLRFGEKIWTTYLVVRLLDEGFHVVFPSEPPLRLGSAVYFEKHVLTVITWR